MLFDCLTQPEHLARFWGPAGTSTPAGGITADLRPGGVLETVMVSDSDGSEYTRHAAYTEGQRPERPAWQEPGVEGGMTTTITLNDLGDGTTEVLAPQANVPVMFATPDGRG